MCNSRVISIDRPGHVRADCMILSCTRARRSRPQAADCMILSYTRARRSRPQVVVIKFAMILMVV